MAGKKSSCNIMKTDTIKQARDEWRNKKVQRNRAPSTIDTKKSRQIKMKLQTSKRI